MFGVRIRNNILNHTQQHGYLEQICY